MPPVHKPLKNDGPACRVCGCSENNACMVMVPLTAKQTRERYAPNVIGCSWVKVEGATPPLCSACSGTEADMAEAIMRGVRMLSLHSTAGIDMAVKIGNAALARRKKRQNQEHG